MNIETADLADNDVVAACHDVFYEVHLTDDPEGSCLSLGLFRNFLKHGWTGDPGEVWIARDSEESGGVAGWYRLALPDMENTSVDTQWRPGTTPPAT